jgi:hypothetical protein
MTAQAVSLKAGQAVALDMLHEGFNGGSANRAFQLWWIKPGASQPEPVPAEDLESPAWTPWRPAQPQSKAGAR